MSIRIHQLSKKIGMDNKDLLALLQQRGYQVTSPSSTVDNISAESLVQEFGSKGSVEDSHAGDEHAAPTAEAATPAAAPAAEAPAHPVSPAIPAGVFVKTKEQIDQEHREKEAAKAAALAAAVIAPPPPAPLPSRNVPLPPPSRSSAPSVPPRPVSPVSTTPPRGISTPGSTPPPSTGTPVQLRPPASATPPPAQAAPAARAPAPVAPPAAVAPRVTPPSHSQATPPPVAARPAPVVPPPVRTAPPAAVPPSPKPLSAPSTPPRIMPAGAPPATPTATGAAPAAAPVAPSGDVKVVQIKPPIVVRDFATLLGLKPFKLISELMEMGIFAALNQSIDENVAGQVAVKHGFLLDIKHRGDAQPVKKEEKAPPPKVDESKFLEPRPPVVCIMGHVDHGKTSLLDKIRSANVVAGEAGGITQHIGAYQVTVNNRKITFLDTPGHAAFTKMRARGANVTDVAILVVAADDGFMPQTDEALQHIRSAEVTPIVAINKIDTKGANIDRVKKQMQDRGLMPEDWGGETITCPISALKGEGIDHLLEMILLQADVLELKANPKAPVNGVVIEAEIEVGRGPTATVLIESGTLKTGDAVTCGPHYAKVRAMFDDQGKQVKEAGPSSAVRVIGWSGTPECGGVVAAAKNEREAKRTAEEAEYELKKQAAVTEAAPKATLAQLLDDIKSQHKRVLRIVVKADVFGSVEAVAAALATIKSDKVSLEIVASDVGQISKNDVLMASAAKAAIVGFNVRTENGVDAVAKHHGVMVNQYEIIYELVDKVRDAMADLLEPETREIKLGSAEVRAVFPVSKGFVAGCLVTEGRIQAQANARLRRGTKIEVESKIVGLRRVKDEVKEVRAGTECGIHLEAYEAYQPGDVIECYEIQKLRPSL
jgi:translation initiation factor IF-2